MVFILDHTGNGHEISEGNKELMNIWKTKDRHDLVTIYKGIGVDESSEEIEFLKELKTHIIYAGRYQFPRKQDDFKEKRTYSTRFGRIEQQIKDKIRLKLKMLANNAKTSC